MKRKAIIKSFVFCIGLLYITGCKSKIIHVPVEKTKTEYINMTQRDSVHLYDSVFIKEKGDTVFFTKYKYLYQKKTRTDTIIRTDSIQIPFPVIETVETNKLTWYQKSCIWFTGIVIFGLAIFLLTRHYRKFF